VTEARDRRSMSGAGTKQFHLVHLVVRQVSQHTWTLLICDVDSWVVWDGHNILRTARQFQIASLLLVVCD
jgi:hypothetical protein